ncbi:MAG: cation transporting ATPase C-terminal domain-containing protein, partial [Gammaproteobacteria bacterium]
IANVFLCRNERDSVFKTGLRGNPLILWGVLVEILLILAIDYTPWGQALFGTAPLPLSVWLIAIGFGAFLGFWKKCASVWCAAMRRGWLQNRPDRTNYCTGSTRRAML